MVNINIIGLISFQNWPICICSNETKTIKVFQPQVISFDVISLKRNVRIIKKLSCRFKE